MTETQSIRSPFEGCTRGVPAADRLFRAWKRRFLADCKRQRPHGCMTVVDEEENLTLVQDQVYFIEAYLGLKLLDGSSQENLKRIERFLSMQTAHNTEGLLEIRFFGGAPIEVYVFVEYLDDIDIADVWAITEFTFMDVYLPVGQKWKGKMIKEFLRDLRDDLTFDYGEEGVVLSHKADGNLLHIDCAIEA